MSSLDVDVVHPFSISHTFCVTFGGLVVNMCVLCNVCLRIFMTSARVECWRPVTERVGHFYTNINNILFVKDVARRHIKNGNGKMKNSYLTLSLFRIYSLLCWHEMPAAHPHAQTATTIRHSWPEWVSVWLEFLRYMHVIGHPAAPVTLCFGMHFVLMYIIMFELVVVVVVWQ